MIYLFSGNFNNHMWKRWSLANGCRSGGWCWSKWWV